VQSGDRIRLSVANRLIEWQVSDAELERRRTESPEAEPSAERGYRQLFLRTVTQADQGADFDFMRATKHRGHLPRSS
jgi:dihydroxy-acid dehydratase